MKFVLEVVIQRHIKVCDVKRREMWHLQSNYHFIIQRIKCWGYERYMVQRDFEIETLEVVKISAFSNQFYEANKKMGTLLSVAEIPPSSGTWNQPDRVQYCLNEAAEGRSEKNGPPETGTDDSSRKRLRERGLWAGETGVVFSGHNFRREEDMPLYIYIYSHQNPKKQSWMTNGCPNSGSDSANVLSFTNALSLPLPRCILL